MKKWIQKISDWGNSLDGVSKFLHTFGTITVFVLGLILNNCRHQLKTTQVETTKAIIEADSTKALLKDCIKADSTGAVYRATKNFKYKKPVIIK